MDFLTNCVGLFFLFLGQNISEKRQHWEGRVNFVLQFDRVPEMWCGSRIQKQEVTFADRKQRMRIVTDQPGLPVAPGNTTRG